MTIHHPCREEGCAHYAEPTGTGRCTEHSRKRERQIDRKGRKVYNSKRWKILRLRKLGLVPLCERCGHIATDVHHRHGVEADPWSLGGLESLCHSCHSAETRREQTNEVGWPE